MPSQAVAKAANAAYSSEYVPTIVVFGGTSGIGEAIARTFVTHTKGRAHIIIVGRNKAAADKIMATFYKPDPTNIANSTYEFVSCDVVSMKAIQVFNEDLKKKLSKINYLILSAGTAGLGGRQDTEEGLDYKMAVRFYSRFAILHGLLPLLKNAQNAGEDTGVLSVLSTGHGKWVDFNDLGMKKRYSGFRAMFATAGYSDFMLQGFSKRAPGIAFVHSYPGLVDTGLFRSNNWILNALLRPAAWLFTVSPEQCGEWMVYGLLRSNGKFARIDDHGEDVGFADMEFATDDEKKAFWKHCLSTVGLPEE
ncbi:NAD(P)-binding protein [Coprinopsis marcescibilis]|uniref:NAD(P)-binding protein n=1 Tax=Coprinopsis marcescibilis TaxID=230819 RepID=A0A5C3KMD0_COPMA|nr:NAD(P)-binding protein [Coprinopsis marcescibilis]